MIDGNKREIEDLLETVSGGTKTILPSGLTIKKPGEENFQFDMIQLKFISERQINVRRERNMMVMNVYLNKISHLK